MSDYMIEPTVNENRFREPGSAHPILGAFSKLSGAQDAAYKVKQKKSEREETKAKQEASKAERDAQRQRDRVNKSRRDARAKVKQQKKESYDHVKYAEADGRVPMTKHLERLTDAEIQQAKAEGRALAKTVGPYRQKTTPTPSRTTKPRKTPTTTSTVPVKSASKTTKPKKPAAKRTPKEIL